MTNTGIKKSKIDLIKEEALSSLISFIKLVHPERVIGKVHEELITWWTRSECKTHQLVLLPRDHQKSALLAYRVAWEITKNPAIRVLYISSTQNLATKQLKMIKDILTSPIYRSYWPEMVHKDEGKREKWTESEISVDHPKRKAEYIRDPTVFTAGLTTTITGLHCDIACLDDVVVDDNAYSIDGRKKVADQASYLASIAGTDGRQWVVGTRYHPKDLYNDFMEQVVEIYDEDTGEIEDSYELYEKFERQVEDRGDGTGQYIWPRMQRADGKWFGFDQRILARKRAAYNDSTKFMAQYYNKPNDSSTSSITSSMFQYYNKALLNEERGYWYYKEEKLNVFCAIDFAYSLNEKSDYTSIVVVGIDKKNNYYILDIERFRTNKISDYFERLFKLYTKWNFRKVRAEITAAQAVIVKDLKENYIKANGLALSVEEVRPTKEKELRIEAALQPRYSNLQMWHYQGGNCEFLEEELLMQNPPHDDIKDCLASVVDMCVPPSGVNKTIKAATKEQFYHSRFGGITSFLILGVLNAFTNLPTLF